ncbi:pro-sigmaK processing inhibitor BofA family protein [Alkalicella caledoniensis]|uniref:Pro-sigmaK processing inhibitor BofA family protein n=1 Tax=Alkalicella caledoniensis TaxID=2731377 RepID=A0A7G9W8G7_ALKCA|nr:pro-sigmaK processing inhibitor BofA family protein [Alkalicella caledoniensis]QNO14979.1 pro-sigmaK processing inhibitor BofA family protein [Alkalicella caledoniensis]
MNRYYKAKAYIDHLFIGGVEMGGNEVVLAFMLVMILIAILLRPLLSKIKGLHSFLLHVVTGLILLIIFNNFGEGAGLYLPINFGTLVISALLGLPGVVLLLILKIVLLR